MKFTDEELKNIITDYNNGATPKELAIKYNRNSGTIIGKLKSLRIYKNTKHRYTNEDIDFIRKYYPIGDFDKIFQRFPSLSKSALMNLCSKHNILASYHCNKKWNDYDLKIVKDYYYKKSLEEIFDMIGGRHSCSAIQTKALKYFGYSKNRAWTAEELSILKTYYPIELVDDVCRRLPNRTRAAIIRQANNLSIPSYITLDTRWTKLEEKLLIDNWETMSDEQLSILMDKDKKSIVGKRCALGLSRVKRYNEASYESVKKYIRGNINMWKNESMKNCGYQCVLTGSKDFHVHHVYSLGLIFDEVIEENNVVLRDSFFDYSQEELSFILDKFIKKQDEYPLGVCIRRDLHTMFHKEYGKRTTPEMWLQFKFDYKNGKYTNQVD